MRPFIICIAGGSGSGKTTIAEMLKLELSRECSILRQDSYYIDQSARFDRDGGAVNFDHPSSIEFELMAKHLDDLKHEKPIEVPIYDFSTHKRLEETETFNPTPFIIVDGILILSQQVLRHHFDMAIFIDANEEIRFQRRLARDIRERGRTEQGVKDQFYTQVKPMHDEFVEPSKEYANIVWENNLDLEAVDREMVNHLESIEHMANP